MGSQMRLSCYTSISISRGASEPGVDLKCVGCIGRRVAVPYPVILAT